MADQLTNYECPACMGPLHFESTTGKMECEYCGSTYSVKEIEDLYKEATQTAADAKKSAWEMSSDEFLSPEGMKIYKCSACSAELVCEESLAATSCPYCGSPVVVPAQFTGMKKPNYLIPFKKDKEMAKKALNEHYKGKFLLPKSFTDQNHINEIKGIYVPFWMFDGEAEGTATFEGEKNRTYSTSNEKVTETKHYDVVRSGRVSFEKIPADASSKMPDDLMDSIEPYDYKDITPFSHAYMAGYMAERYDETPEENAKRVEIRAKESLHQALRQDVKGYDSVSDRTSKISVTQGKVDYALMPVWLLYTKWNDQDFLFAMNGQTGKMVGDLPMDKSKYRGVMGITFLLTAVIMYLISGGSMLAEIGMGTIVGMVLLPLLVAWIVAGILKGQLKSVAKATNANQYTLDQAAITRRVDRYTHTTETRTPIQKEPKK